MTKRLATSILIQIGSSVISVFNARRSQIKCPDGRSRVLAGTRHSHAFKPSSTLAPSFIELRSATPLQGAVRNRESGRLHFMKRFSCHASAWVGGTGVAGTPGRVSDATAGQ
jgi:hypothetical protein